MSTPNMNGRVTPVNLILVIIATNVIIAIIAILAPSSSASAQSINVDFGTHHGVPPSTYAGAALPGVWNAVSFKSEFPPPKIFEPVALVGLDGRPTDATITTEGAFGTLGPIWPLEGPVGDDAALFGDALFGHSPDIAFELHFAGLEPGAYRVVLHMWVWPAETFGMVCFLEDGGEPPPTVITSGPWPGALTLGVTTHVLTTPVDDGGLSLMLVGAGPGSFFNGNNLIQGVQLWKFDDGASECSADLTDDDLVDGGDLAIVLGQWGECAANGGCVADINDDGVIDGNDLTIVLGGWGPCGRPPVECGANGSGDCYASHAGPGCSEAACCASICALDPYCCSETWDALCAGRADLTSACAAAVHPHCGLAGSGSCFAIEDTLPGCADSACCAAVCAIDSYCCTFVWDDVCVSEASKFCR